MQDFLPAGEDVPEGWKERQKKIIETKQEMLKKIKNISALRQAVWKEEASPAERLENRIRQIFLDSKKVSNPQKDPLPEFERLFLEMDSAFEDRNIHGLQAHWKKLNNIFVRTILKVTEPPEKTREKNAFVYGEEKDRESLEETREIEPQKIEMGHNFLWRHKFFREKTAENPLVHGRFTDAEKEVILKFAQKFLETFYALRDQFSAWEAQWKKEGEKTPSFPVFETGPSVKISPEFLKEIDPEEENQIRVQFPEQN
ncbi:MAG: hypothetical protein K9M51_03590 [Candidatus Gracilibacteria bacterium]|nr:hypothetical protein [Candidatus Gracilibacteria bacterium]